jgi:hypothetical protein
MARLTTLLTRETENKQKAENRTEKREAMKERTLIGVP